MKHCTDCYIKKRAEILIGAWLENKYPWDNSPTGLVLVTNIRTEQNEVTNIRSEQNEEQQVSTPFQNHYCPHSESHKDRYPPPGIVNTKCHYCSDLWEDCECRCGNCGDSHRDSQCDYKSYLNCESESSLDSDPIY